MTMKQTLWIPAGIVVLAAAVSLAQARDKEKPTQKADESAKPKMQCQCPMMASMKGIKTFADSPAVLLSQGEELGLSEGQKKRLQEIQEQARQDARDVLSIKQQETLKESPKGPLSMMDLGMMRMKKGMGQKEQKGMMCSMCMKMMQKKAQSEEKVDEEEMEDGEKEDEEKEHGEKEDGEKEDGEKHEGNHHKETQNEE